MTYPLGKFPLRKLDWSIITIAWGIIQVIVFLSFGINDKEEATKYISAAQKLLAGTADFALHDLWYSGYIALNIIMASLGLPVAGMYALQLFLSFVSLVYFLKLLSIWIKQRLVLILSGLLYSTCIIVQQWVVQLYTDTVFYMLLIIGTYYLITAHFSKRHGLMCFLCILLLPFFRPVGFIFVFLACMHWMIDSPGKNRRLIVAGFVYFAVLLFLAVVSLDSGGDYFYPLHNIEANIICGYPSQLQVYETTPYRKDAGVVAYLWQNPELTVRLFTARLFKVFDLTRPFFSPRHNLIIAASSISYYILALVGIYSILKNKQADRMFLIVGILIFALPSIVFCVEWHGRMSLPSMCYILLLSGLGMDVMARKVLRIAN